MPMPLAVLIVEDMENDVQLLVHLLEKADYELVYEKVETAGQMRAALEKRTWDIVISDYKMPQFDGHAALQLLQDTGRDIPFIVVSGTIGEETAVSMMKAGAHDYLIKGNLARLIPAVKRELEQAEVRRERKQAEVQLRKLSRAVDQNPASIIITDLQGNIEYVNPKFSQVTGYGFAEILGQNPRILKSEHTTREEYKKMWETILSGNVWQGELLNKKKNGETFWEFATIAPVFSEDGKITNFLALKENITERKQAELELQHRKEDLELINMLNDVINRGENLDVLIDTLNNETKRIYSATACTVSLLSPDGKIMTIQRNTISPAIINKIEQLIGQPILKIHVHVREGGYIHRVLQNEEGTITSDPKLIQQWIMEIAESTIMSPVLRVLAQKFVPQIYKILNIGSTLAVPLTLGTRVIGLLELASNALFTEDVLYRVRSISGQVTAAILRKRAEEGIHQHVIELEMLYQSGLLLSQLLNPKEIGQKTLELLEEKLDWHHTRIRLYHPQDDSLELLDFNQPGLKGKVERREVVERFQTLITKSNQGISGWVIEHGQTVRSGDVSNDPRYVEAYPGIRSGLYVPMKLGESIVGVISIEDEQSDAFNEADERLIVTLANQAASAFENARLFEEIHQRVTELETLNSISLVLRAVSKQNEMLSIVLDEVLAILNTPHGSIELYNKATDNLDKTITRGWTTQMTEPPQKIGEGIAGKVFISGEAYISREFASDPETCASSRNQIPANWGGACLPIRTTQQTLGVMTVYMPSERELNKDDIRLLSILSEMIGAALQRMQLHEQTVRRLEQLNALRAVDQAISSSRDMRLTLNILLTHTISQLDVDAADVLLLHSGSNLLELVAGRGFHTLLLEDASLSNSIAGRAIMEHQTIMALDFETVSQNLQFGKIWEEEGFACYWCVPLIVKGEVKGVLEVYRRTTFTPDSEWLEFLETLAGQAAIAIDSTQLFENLQRANLDLSLAYDATIEGWSRAMDLRDHETEGHTLRVTDLTVKLARAMHVSESQLTAIRRGALLHDIGKMGVPDSILLKEGKLTGEEWVVMRRHPILARDMLMPIAYLNDALNIPYCHHEKWDGTGYPQGLKGDHIPLVARIFAIVDVWDALTNTRTYRRKWTKQKARQYIKEQSGKHFDPQVVVVFLKHIENY